MMNKLIVYGLIFWGGSVIALFFAHLTESSPNMSDKTISILYDIHFAFFLVGLGLVIAGIIRWARSR